MERNSYCKIEENGSDPLKISVGEEESIYHVYHIARLFYPYVDIEVKVDLNPCDFSLKKVIEDGRGERLVIRKEDEGGEGFSRSYSFSRAIKKEDIKRSFYYFLEELTARSFPWGTMIGVRPVKIALKLLREGKGKEEIIDHYEKNYLVKREKAIEAIGIAQRERDVLKRIHEDSIGLYLHMPFCPSKCSYCSFLSLVDSKGDLISKYCDQLIRDIRDTKREIKKLGLVPSFIYFGGGTPTTPSNSDFKRILDAIKEEFIDSYDIKEFTVEAGRPDSLNEEKLRLLKEFSCNRISINPQTFNDDTLVKIGRNHKVKDLIASYNMARSLGHNNINMDIIVGLPGETIKDIENTVKMIKELRPESVTVHTLSLKKGAKLKEGYKDEGIKSYEELDIIKRELTRSSYHPYYLYRQKNTLDNGENVGFSKEAFESIYNIAMMEETHTIIAMGAGAISKAVLKSPINGHEMVERVYSHKDVNLYLEKYDEVMENKIRLMETYKMSLHDN